MNLYCPHCGSDRVYCLCPGQPLNLAHVIELPQRQDGTLDQLNDLIRVAVRLGMRDAADWVKKNVDRQWAVGMGGEANNP